METSSLIRDLIIIAIVVIGLVAGVSSGAYLKYKKRINEFGLALLHQTT